MKQIVLDVRAPPEADFGDEPVVVDVVRVTAVLQREICHISKATAVQEPLGSNGMSQRILAHERMEALGLAVALERCKPVTILVPTSCHELKDVVSDW